MKIFFCSRVFPDENGFQGGIFILNQAAALKRHGYDTAVLFLDFRSLRKKRRWGFSRYQISGVDVYRWAFPCGPIFPVIRAIAPILIRKLYQRAIEDLGKPDLLYAHFGDAACDARIVHGHYGVRYAVLEHDSGILNETYHERELTLRKEAYDHAAAVMAVSEALASKIRKLTRNSVSVVPNILPDFFFEGEPALGHPNTNGFTFVGVGNLVPGKAFDKTIRAFATLSKDSGDLRLYIVGDGPERGNLMVLAEQLGVHGQVCFTGRIANRELPSLLQKCDCFVLPSRFETFGVAYLEAMASGLPVIATRCGGPEEFVNNHNGLLIPVGDQAALEKAMKYMIANHTLYDSCSIRSFAYTFCSENSFFKNIESVFSCIAGNIES